ncbi:MAG TPA: hypothetical protein VNO30_14310 [Kofleriaceae bacterium]|nr:hypothetical protein [Kofleriaceae bacterium]
MNIHQIEFLVREGAYSLANHLETHWPAEWDADSETGREVREANTVLHLGHALLRAGFLTYAEVPHARDGGAASCFDLVAKNLSDNTWLVAEVKRAYVSTKSLDSITRDLERIVRSWRGVDMIDQPANVYGLFVATTWRADLARWWPDSDKHPDPSIDAMWANPVASVTENAKSAWGSVAFSSYFSDQYPHHYLLYALFPLV